MANQTDAQKAVAKIKTGMALTDYELDLLGATPSGGGKFVVTGSSQQSQQSNVATTATVSAPIKPAQSNLLVNKQDTPIEALEPLFFEDLTGVELIQIARSTMLTGSANLEYQPIKNIPNIAMRYSPQNILSLQGTDKEYFRKFPIFLRDYLPEDGEGTGTDGAIRYIEEGTGNLVLNIKDLDSDLKIEFQLLTLNSLVNKTVF